MCQDEPSPIVSDLRKDDLGSDQSHDSDSDSRVCEQDIVKRCHNNFDFLNLHHSTPQALKSPVEGSKKPFIPPLDLTSLHENCEGNGELNNNYA